MQPKRSFSSWQGVRWIVMNEPNYMSSAQLDNYRRAVALHEGSKVRYRCYF